jgi:hypothetical protein
MPFPVKRIRVFENFARIRVLLERRLVQPLTARPGAQPLAPQFLLLVFRQDLPGRSGLRLRHHERFRNLVNRLGDAHHDGSGAGF